MAREVHQSEISKRAFNRIRYFWIFWSVPALLSCYVLSIGPALRLMNLDVLPSQCAWAYDPLVSMAYHFPPLYNFLDWYVADVWHTAWRCTL